MRVLFIEEGHGVGGSTICLYYMMRGLKSRGVTGVAWFPSPNAWSDRFRGLGIEVIHGSEAPPGQESRLNGHSTSRSLRESAFYRRLSFYKSHWRDHARHVREWTNRIEAIRPDVVYGNNALPLNLAALTAGSDLGLGVVCALRGLQPLRAPHRAFGRRLQFGAAVSEMVRRYYLGAGFDPDQILRVYDGIDLVDYPFQEPAALVPKEGGRLLFLGRLTAWKGAEVLLQAIARLSARRPAIQAVVAGDGPARAEWERMGGDLGIAERIRFVGFQPDIMPLLRQADLLVHASTAPEPFGRVLIEGMAAGVPVVASDHGAAPEIIEHGRSGWLAPPGDAGALAAVIDTALDPGVARVALARAARTRVEEQFTVGRTDEAVSHMLDRVKIRR
ncbi:MAG: glycosyltransferase family 4 protein [Candidatus Eisenbacteria bacterium]|nr:glycosyltransferase family 4 protein [Candidatus Eisenbacteria bacterium]